jgi:hypothetical protein
MSPIPDKSFTRTPTATTVAGILALSMGAGYAKDVKKKTQAPSRPQKSKWLNQTKAPSSQVGSEQDRSPEGTAD